MSGLTMPDKMYTSFIDGQTESMEIHPASCDSGTNVNPVPVVSPATNTPVLHFAPATVEQVEAAMESAHCAFSSKSSDSWSQPSMAPVRASVLMNIASELRSHIDRLADLEVQQIGRPKKEMKFQLSRLPEWFEYYASLLRVRQDAITPFGSGYLNTVKRVPLGVIVQITPFNHPLLISIKKLAPALAAGNTVVIKPSEQAPATIIELAKICSTAGLPPGVLHVVLGGQEVGEQLVSHPKTAKVDFTGGPKAGRKIGQAAGANLCSYTAELGGKAPMIVFGPKNGPSNDLDNYLDPLVNGCAFGAFIASGQTCIAGTRILVEHTIYEEFVRKLVDKTKVFKMGDPETMDTTIGPVITKQQMNLINHTVHRELESQDLLDLLCGGKQYRGFSGNEAHLNHGNYYEPTVIAAKASIMDSDDATLCLHHSSDVFQKELFGPVVALIPFKDESQAIVLANDSKYSLGCSIWTHDLVQAHEVADGVNAGIVWINDHHKNHPSSPWGGLTKESGIGRENGIDAFLEYTQSKSVVMNCRPFNTDWFKDPNARYN